MFCHFLLYSKVRQLYMYIYIFFFSHFLHNVASEVIIIPCAIQQDLIAYPLQMLQFASTNPKLPVHPTPSFSRFGNHKSLLCVHELVFSL